MMTTKSVEVSTDIATYNIVTIKDDDGIVTSSASIVVGGECIGELRYTNGTIMGNSVPEKFVIEFEEYLKGNLTS